MHPFKISLYEHVPLKFLMTKRLGKIKKYIYWANKHLLILKIILTDVDLCINARISKWIICKHNFSLPLLTSNVPFQIGKSTPRGTCIPGCEALVWYYLSLGLRQESPNSCLKLRAASWYRFMQRSTSLVYTLLNKNLHDLSSYDVIIKNKN